MTAPISWSTTLAHVVPTTDPVPADSEVQPGPWMAIIILLLIAVSVFLWFSMRKQLGRIRVPTRQESEEPAGSERPDDGAAPGAEGGNDRPAGPPVS